LAVATDTALLYNVGVVEVMYVVGWAHVAEAVEASGTFTVNVFNFCWLIEMVT